MRVSVKAVENGVILILEGKNYVFNDSDELGRFLIDRAKDESKGVSSSLFDLVLSTVPSDKVITAIKLVRQLTGMGLRESKDLVDSVKVSHGATVLSGVSKATALEGQALFHEQQAGFVTFTMKHVM